MRYMLVSGSIAMAVPDDNRNIVNIITNFDLILMVFISNFILLLIVRCGDNPLS